MKSALLALLLLVLALPAQAQTTATAPAFSTQRVLVTAGLDYARYDDPIVPTSERKWELQPNLNVAYNLGKFSSLTFSYSRGLTKDKFNPNLYRAGIRIRLFNGAKS